MSREWYVFCKISNANDRVRFPLGQAAQVLQEFINETAEFFMKTYPQLKTGREYRKIGLALIKKYPCLAEKGNHLKPEVRHKVYLFLLFQSIDLF